ncbi:leucine-rich repeat receptor protein kinase EMS1-like [Pyrus communis]|uniref:leucine-rich repeat receptor protein kinase EMS1-like n=1 Tax=Pyrus communis TaxID=23211 RepID=UPI0035C1BCC4
MRKGIHYSRSLFDLQHLQSLKFADNRYYGSQIPSAIGKLANLRYLNLSRNGFGGQIPIGISHLIKLTVLDLSENYLELKKPNLTMLVQSLTELQELYFDYVNLSAEKGGDWCKVISSSLPHLRALSLYNTSLSGPIDRCLAKLTSISVIRLDYTHLYSPVPAFFANFSNLTSLTLSVCGLCGTFPPEIVRISTLQTVDLLVNQMLQGSLPEFPKKGYLRILDLSITNFSGVLPVSIGNLKMLSEIDIPIDGVPKVDGKPHILVRFTNVREQVQQFLTSISSTHWENLVNLAFVDLSPNLLDGGIALSKFSLPLLQALDLSNNEFSRQLHEFSNVSSLVDTQVNDRVSP